MSHYITPLLVKNAIASRRLQLLVLLVLVLGDVVVVVVKITPPTNLEYFVSN